MHSSENFTNKIKCLTDTLKDASNNLKSLDSIILSPMQRPASFEEIRPLETIYQNDNVSKIKEKIKFSKIEQNLEDLLQKQDKLEIELEKMKSAKPTTDNRFGDVHLTRNLERTASLNFPESFKYLSTEPTSETTYKVSKRLQDAQEKLRSERNSLEKNSLVSSAVVDISADLKSALVDNSNRQKSSQTNIDTQQQQQQMMETLTKRVVKTESENSSLKFEIDSIKRQLLNETGAKNLLNGQVETFKSKSNQLEDEIIRLKKELNKAILENDVLQKKIENQDRYQERIEILQKDNDELKQKPNTCNHLTEIEELRRKKEKLERSKYSFNDQISELTKQVDSKQAHISRLMDEVRNLQDELSSNRMKFKEKEKAYQECQNDLRHQEQMYKDVLIKMENLERNLIEIDAEKSKGISIRDDNIERLENQCSRLKSEIGKLNEHDHEINSIMNEMQKENDTLRQQLFTSQSQTDALRKELESLLETRSVQQELLKRREQEVESYYQLNKELKLQLETEERNAEKYKCDAKVYSDDLYEARETNAILEERISSLSISNASQQEQLAGYRSEISNLNRQIRNLESKLSLLNQQISDYKSKEGNCDFLRQQLQEYQDQQDKLSVDVAKKTQKIELQSKSQVSKLEEMLTAERAASKVLMRRCDRQMTEINRLHEEYWSREQLVQKFRRKYAKIREELQNLMKQKDVEKSLQETNFNEEREEHENELKLAKDRYSDIVEERDQILRWIVTDLDNVVELVSEIDMLSLESRQLKSSSHLLRNPTVDLKNIPQTSASLSTLGGVNPQKCFIDIKAKLSWLRSEINKTVNQLYNSRTENNELKDELDVANTHLHLLEKEKDVTRDAELEEARKCIAKMKIKEKNEINLQLKCDRLQEELQQIRGHLSLNYEDY